MSKIERLLIIDVGYIEYTKQFYSYCSKYIDTTLITKHYTPGDDSKILHFFYKKSEKMRDNYFRKLLRGLEYIIGYIKVIMYLKHNYYDYVHIQWPVMPSVDIIFFKIIKKRCGKLIYTAHDVIPHINPENKLKTFNKLYKIPDKIVVHGYELLKEMKEYFPQYINKTYIQDFGVNYSVEKSYSKEVIDKHQAVYNAKINGKKIISFIGQIFYNKGTDRLLEYWEKNIHDDSSLLVIVGRIRDSSGEFENLFQKLKSYSNVYLYLNRFSEEEETFFYSNSSIVILPYRHASMSGVFFTAAEYKKTVLVTNVGSLEEYIPNKENVFIVENNDNDIFKALDKIIREKDLNELEMMGNSFHKDIYDKYSWNNIIPKLINNCYRNEDDYEYKF